MKPVILVIDDDPRVKRSLELTFVEYAFTGAASGAEGLKQLEKPNEIDLVLLDVRMNGQDGIQALEGIKRINPEVPVIMLTAFGSREAVVQSLQGHADDFVDKPYRVEDMKQRLVKFLKTKSGREHRSGAAPDPVQRVVRLLEKNFEKFLTLQDASALVSLSPKYLSRKFKQKTRRGFTEFRIGLRMNEAKKLLADTSFNLYEIAERIGYQNAESFIKRFKKQTGCTPTEFRLQHPASFEGRVKQKRT